MVRRVILRLGSNAAKSEALLQGLLGEPQKNVKGRAIKKNPVFFLTF